MIDTELVVFLRELAREVCRDLDAPDLLDESRQPQNNSRGKDMRTVYALDPRLPHNLHVDR